MSALRRAAELAEEHLAGIADRRVDAALSYEDAVAALDEPLPEHGEDPVAVIEHLAATAGPATVASPGDQMPCRRPLMLWQRGRNFPSCVHNSLHV